MLGLCRKYWQKARLNVCFQYVHPRTDASTTTGRAPCAKDVCCQRVHTITDAWTTTGRAPCAKNVCCQRVYTITDAWTTTGRAPCAKNVCCQRVHTITDAWIDEELTDDVAKLLRKRKFIAFFWLLTIVRLMPKGINILGSQCLFLSLSLSLSLSISLSNFSNTAFQTGITPEVVDRIPPS